MILLHAKPADVILPVGEIGKILQVRTGNPLISTEIKERYGGLKKFLVDCEGIIVHDDHPFNPSVTVDEGMYQQLASSGALNGIDVGVVQITGAPGGNARRSKKTRGRKKRNRASKKSQGEANVQPVVLDF